MRALISSLVSAEAWARRALQLILRWYCRLPEEVRERIREHVNASPSDPNILVYCLPRTAREPIEPSDAEPGTTPGHVRPHLALRGYRAPR